MKMNRRKMLAITGTASIIPFLPLSNLVVNAKTKSFTTGNMELDKELYSDKEHVLIRVVKTGCYQKFFDLLAEHNDPSLYAVIEAENFDYENLPQCKYIFVKNLHFQSSVDSCPNTPSCGKNDFNSIWNSKKYRLYWHKVLYHGTDQLCIYDIKNNKEKFFDVYSETQLENIKKEIESID